MSDTSILVLKSRLASNTVKELVARICLKHPSCKGDYRLLIWRVWREYGIKMSFKDFNTLRSAPSSETITRRFRELKQERPAEFNPSDSTVEKRFNNELVYHEYYGVGRVQATLLDC